MGCGESKNVATGNTISRTNSKAGSRSSKASETIEETSKPINNASSTLVPGEGKNVNQESGESAALQKEENAETDNEKKSIIVEETKLADQEKKLETQGENAKTNVETVQEVKLAEEKNEEIVEDQNLAEEKRKEIEDKKLAEEKPEEKEDKILAQEKPEETANGEPEIVKEETLVKGTEAAEITEAEVSTPVEKEEEKPAVSPAEDLKTQ